MCESISLDETCGDLEAAVDTSIPVQFRMFLQDPEYDIYDPFDKLSAKNLLDLQAELYSLEGQLQGLENNKPSRNADPTANAIETQTSIWLQKKKNTKQSIRLLIKEYQEALLLRSQILALDQPPPDLLKIFALDGGVIKNARNLITLQKFIPKSRLIEFLTIHPSFHRLLIDYSGNGIEIIYGRRLRLFVRSVAIILSIMVPAMLLLGAIVSLYVVTAPKARLGMICAYMVVFATSVALFSKASRIEIFGATAAYAAVLVVFVSGNLGTGA